MPLLDIHSSHLSYGDTQVSTTNPKQVYFDWTRHFNSIQVDNPLSNRFDVLPGQSLQLFTGTRSTSIDGTTQFSIALNTTQSSLYRVTNTSGTAPAFRTARAFNPSSVAITLTVNNNATVDVTIGSGNFNAQVGDQLFIPGTSTGDAVTPFSPLNVGLWVVLAASATKLTITRPVGIAFQGVSEVVTPTTSTQLLIFSATGVQIGDSVEISAGFSSVTQQTFTVTGVTPTWIEFVSTQALPLETAIVPTATGMTFYTMVKRYVHIEVSQSAVLRFNADASNNVRVTPLVAGDMDQMGHATLLGGSVWQLTVVNRSTTATMIVNLFTAE